MTNDIYVIVREAIKQAKLQSGRLYEEGQEAHYLALAAIVALEQAGYSIAKRVDV